MVKITSLLFVSVLILSGTVLATSLEEIFPIKITKQNQSQYNIAVNVSLPTDFEGNKDENTKNRVVNLKVPKKIDGTASILLVIPIFRITSITEVGLNCFINHAEI